MGKTLVIVCEKGDSLKFLEVLVEKILSSMLSSVKHKFDSIGARIIRILTKFTKDTNASGVFTDDIMQEGCERLFLTIVSNRSDRHLESCNGRVSDKKVYTRRIFA